MKNITKSDPAQQADERASSFYWTRQRRQLVDYLSRQTVPRSAKEIHRDLRKEGLNIGLTTIYRSLRALANNGILCQVWTEEGIQAARFSVAQTYEELPIRLHCERCGGEEALSCEALAELQEHFRQDHHFELNLNKLVLGGTCGACQAAEWEES